MNNKIWVKSDGGYNFLLTDNFQKKSIFDKQENCLNFFITTNSCGKEIILWESAIFKEVSNEKDKVRKIRDEIFDEIINQISNGVVWIDIERISEEIEG